MPSRRVLLVVVPGLALVVYLIARPAIAEGNPHLHLWEFPIALVITGIVVWAALRPPREVRELAAPPEPWRRHAQKVRALPDPESARLRAPLDAWATDGANPDEAARILARAYGAPTEAEREALAQRLLADMNGAGSARKRQAFLRRVLSSPTNPQKPDTGA